MYQILKSQSQYSIHLSNSNTYYLPKHIRNKIREQEAKLPLILKTVRQCHNFVVHNLRNCCITLAVNVL